MVYSTTTIDSVKGGIITSPNPKSTKNIVLILRVMIVTRSLLYTHSLPHKLKNTISKGSICQICNNIFRNFNVS